MRSIEDLFADLNPVDKPAARRLLEIVRSAIDSVEPTALVTKALGDAEGVLADALAAAPSITVFALGKAAVDMAWGAHRTLGDRVARGLVISDQAGQVPSWAEFVIAGHPLPDHRSTAAAHAALDLVESVTGNQLLLALVSGGGSSLMELSHEALDPDDVRDLMDQLIRSSAPIETINGVRSRLSRVKAGRLAARCTGRVVTLAIADVIGSDPRYVASGPTVAAPPTTERVLDVFETYGLSGPAVERVRSFVEESQSQARVARAFPAEVIGDGRTAGEAALAAAHRLDLSAGYITDRLSGDACEAASTALADTPEGTLGVFTGETTVAVVGSGRGGRNQHAALSAAIEMKGGSYRFVACGTDGIDGPTDAAGAYVDGATVRDVVEARRHLADCNAYPYLDRSQSLLRTGKTGTNVGDLWIVDKTG